MSRRNQMGKRIGRVAIGEWIHWAERCVDERLMKLGAEGINGWREGGMLNKIRESLSEPTGVG